MKINLKKLVYQYKFLNLEVEELKEQHIKLTVEFESEFKDIISKSENGLAVDENKSDKKKHNTDESVKEIYKKTAKRLHPDKGGDEEEFKQLNERYKSNDLLGVIDLAVDNKVDFDLKDDDMELLTNSVNSLKGKIDEYKNKLCYVWKYGTPFERGQVINTLQTALGITISVDDLNDDQKKKLGLQNE
tara:strand:+ start:801 stop:1364 length:564 start_codon:yes stop_codon:yes gene_type:complete